MRALIFFAKFLTVVYLVRHIIIGRQLIECCQGTEQADGMIHKILYMEESQGLEGPEKISTRGPARCHVTRRRAQRDCPKQPPLPT